MSGRIIGQPQTPWHLWVVGLLALLWNAGGVYSWYSVMLGDPEAMGFPADAIAYLQNYPAWALVAYTMGTWGAFLGSLALLARKALARWLFVIAIIGLGGTTLYERVFSTLPQSLQGTGQIIFTVIIWATTLALLLYARAMSNKGVLR